MGTPHVSSRRYVLKLVRIYIKLCNGIVFGSPRFKVVTICRRKPTSHDIPHTHTHINTLLMTVEECGSLSVSPAVRSLDGINDNPACVCVCVKRWQMSTPQSRPGTLLPNWWWGWGGFVHVPDGAASALKRNTTAAVRRSH